MSSPFPINKPEDGQPGPMLIPKRQVSRETQAANQQEIFKKDNPQDFDERAKENAARIA